MWSKIKKYVWGAIIAIVSVLLSAIGIKNKQLKKEKEKNNDLQQQIETEEIKDQIEIEVQEIADQEEQKIDQAIMEVKEDEAEQLVTIASEEKPSAQSYNELVENWNNEKK